MKPWAIALGLLLLGGAVVAAGVAFLRPVSETVSPGITVASQFTPEGDAHLDIEVGDLEAGERYTALLQGVSDGNVGASAGVLGDFVADDEGTGRLSTSSATLAAGAEVPLTVDAFRDGGGLISIVSASGETVATVVVTAPPAE